nr:TcdA/TcdB pore-forming domain-containing protein [Photobacterium leiognathi]
MINNHNELLSVDLEGLYFVIISEDASKWPSLKQLSQYLDSRIDNQHLNSNFIRIENFIPPGKSEKVGTAYYQVDKKRFVYTPLPAKKDLLNNAQLITIIGDLAYFQAAHELWLVDIEKTKSFVNTVYLIGTMRKKIRSKHELGKKDNICILL